MYRCGIINMRCGIIRYDGKDKRIKELHQRVTELETQLGN